MKLKKLFASLCVFSAVIASPVFANESTPTPAATQAMATSDNVATQSNATPNVSVSDKLNINTASAAEIQKALIGIGAKKAEAIVQYREKHGSFTAAEQLLEVQGIGKATLEKNRDRIIF